MTLTTLMTSANSGYLKINIEGCLPISGGGVEPAPQPVSPTAVPGKFYPTPGGGSAAIQAAINAAEAAGAGTVELGNTTWAMTVGITADPTLASLHGDGAVLDFSTAGDVDFITLTQRNASGYKANLRQRTGGFKIKGPAKGTGTGIVLHTPAGNDWSSACTLANIAIEHVKRGVHEGANAYLYRLEDVSIGWAETCLTRDGVANNGEAINYRGCIFFNSDKVLALYSSNQDHYFYGCSFDYCKQIGYTDSLIEMHGCHFESSSGQTAGLRQFEADNGGRWVFFGGLIALITDASQAPDYLFVSYPSNGGGWYEMYGTWIHGPVGSVAMCNDFSKTSKPTMVPWAAPTP